jgi:hypothetical protein
MAETIEWCNMMVTLFYILSIIYFVQLYLIENFNPIGKEFTTLTILGLAAILVKKERKPL